MLDYVLSNKISYNLITTDSLKITRYINIIVIKNYIVRLFANVSKKLTSHIMKSEFLYDEIIVIRFITSEDFVCMYAHLCVRGPQLSSLLPVFLRASSLASRQLHSASK